MFSPHKSVYLFVDSARIACGAGSMKRSNVRPSVCPSLSHRWPAGLLLSAPRAEDIDRLLLAPAPRSSRRRAEQQIRRSTALSSKRGSVMYSCWPLALATGCFWHFRPWRYVLTRLLASFEQKCHQKLSSECRVNNYKSLAVQRREVYTEVKTRQ